MKSCVWSFLNLPFTLNFANFWKYFFSERCEYHSFFNFFFNHFWVFSYFFVIHFFCCCYFREYVAGNDMWEIDGNEGVFDRIRWMTNDFGFPWYARKREGGMDNDIIINLFYILGESSMMTVGILVLMRNNLIFDFHCFGRLLCIGLHIMVTERLWIFFSNLE